MIAYVVSLPALFAAWGRELDEHRSDVIARLDDATRRQDHPPVAQLREHTRAIQANIHHLRAFILQVRERIARFHSDQICKTDHHRRFLTKFMLAADLARLEDNLNERFVAIEQMFARFADEEQRKSEERAAQRGNVLNVLALAFGVAALAEVLALANVVAHPSPSDGLIWTEVIAIAVIALVSYVVLWRYLSTGRWAWQRLRPSNWWTRK